MLGFSCGAAPNDDDEATESAASARHSPGTSGGESREGGYLLPVASMTPGAVFNVTAETVCRPGYAGSVRDVPLAEKKRVAAAYNFTGAYSEVEFDHLISLEIGGSNSPENLWPQPIEEALVKDRLEDYLHREVCAGRMSIEEAQRGIATDWVALWNKLGRP
jgi:hypothetical protein